jgi:Ca2+-binding RTX toxin-like protein
MFGEAGLDILIGNFGNDTESGGADADIFRFSVDSRRDRILDFEDDEDELQISSAYGYADAAAVVATATVSGNDITLHLTANDEIMLVGFGTDPNLLLNDIVIF